MKKYVIIFGRKDIALQMSYFPVKKKKWVFLKKVLIIGWSHVSLKKYWNSGIRSRDNHV